MDFNAREKTWRTHIESAEDMSFARLDHSSADFAEYSTSEISFRQVQMTLRISNFWELLMSLRTLTLRPYRYRIKIATAYDKLRVDGTVMFRYHIVQVRILHSQSLGCLPYRCLPGVEVSIPVFPNGICNWRESLSPRLFRCRNGCELRCMPFISIEATNDAESGMHAMHGAVRDAWSV